MNGHQNVNYENGEDMFDLGVKQLQEEGHLFVVGDEGRISKEPYSFNPKFLKIVSRVKYDEKSRIECHVFVQYTSTKKRRLVLLPDGARKKSKLSKGDQVLNLRKGVNTLYRIQLMMGIFDEELVQDKCNEANRNTEGKHAINIFLMAKKREAEFAPLMDISKYSLSFYIYPFASMMPGQLRKLNRQNDSLAKVVAGLQEFKERKKVSFTSNVFKNKQDLILVNKQFDKWFEDLDNFCERHDLRYGKGLDSIPTFFYTI